MSKDNNKKGKVLVVDNQADQVELLSTILDHSGFEVYQAYGGGEALEIVQNNPLDVILLDVSMPEMSGLEVCRRIKQDRRVAHIPVIMISAIRTEVKDIALGLDIGADEYIIKPVERAELLARVRSMLRVKEVRDELEVQQSLLHKAYTELKQKTGRIDRLNQALKLQNKRLTEKNLVIEQEMEMAREFQESLLPDRFPVCPHLRFAVKYVPARIVSGDFYDFVEKPDGSVGVLTADVAGHALPAALMATLTKTAFDHCVATANGPAELMSQVNECLCRTFRMGQFVTMFYGVFNPENDTFTYARGGHPSPMLIPANGGPIELLDAEGKLVGAFPEGEYEEKTVTLSEGDKILLFTDGIKESMSEAGARYGQQRFREVVTEHRGAAVDNLLDQICSDFADFSGGECPSDDVTLVGLEVRKSS